MADAILLSQLLQTAADHHRAGRLPEAEALYRQILAREPDHADTLNLMGYLAQQVGRADIAVQLGRRAVQLSPDAAPFHLNLGLALAAMGQLEPAIVSYRNALALRPGFPEAHNNLGNALRDLGQTSLAVAEFEAALKLKPDMPEALSNLGAAISKTDRHEEAIQLIRRAIAIRPNLAEAHNNLATALRQSGDINAAIPEYRIALQLQPNHAFFHYNLAFALLMNGDYEEGWIEHEWRFRVPELKIQRQGQDKPQWDGSPLNGRRILLYAEQGFGDTFQFARYAPLVADQGGRVILACPSELVQTLKSLRNIDQIVTNGDPIPEFDLQCSLLTLPLVFQTRLDSIPSETPYLHSNPAEVQRWNSRLDGNDLRVGIAWAGRPTYRDDSTRSMPAAALQPLSQLPGVRFISLQKQPTGDGALPWLTDWTTELTNFSETAALIESLDLVIAVDTAVAHLSAALGKPTWLLLSAAPDWRWLLTRDTSPWYPTARLFRQSKLNDWSEPIANIAHELRSLLQSSQRHG